MNNEPVALMTEYGIHPLYEGALQEGMFLYNHPAKTLTDEEIIKVYQSLWKFLPSEEPRLAKDIKDFARAILKKASEK